MPRQPEPSGLDRLTHPGGRAPALGMDSGPTTPDHRMDPRDTRRPGRAAEDHRCRGAGRAWPRHGRAAGGRSPSSGPATPSTAITPPTWRFSSPRRSAPTRVSWPDGWPTRLTAADGIASAEVAGPGFVNLRIEASAQGVIVNNVIDAGPTYGDSDRSRGQNINLEFVSANPTGPIHIGGTRWAAVGDALGRLLTTQGADVVREYYFNDHGAQIDRFARSLVAAAKGEPAPEDGYAGDYIADIAAKVVAAGAGRAEPARRRAAGDVPRHRRRPDVHPHQGVAARIRHRLRRLHPRRLDAHQRPGRAGHRQAARDRQHLREGRRNLVAHQRLSATTRTASSSRATASPPTSPAISPTTWTSGSAASTCASTCSAPTTTATSPGSRPPPPRSATTPTPSRC